MKPGLDWAEITRSELADHLQSATLIRSQAFGSTSLYHCKHTDGETIAVALPGGNGLIIGVAMSASPTLERRKQRPDEATEPSGKQVPF